jgi:formate transporter
MAEHAVALAGAKSRLPFDVALIRGIFCNWLVCLAVFMAVAARDITGKLLACYAPIMAFVASGFEHSVANMYFIPTGLFIAAELRLTEPGLSWGNFLWVNLLPVTLGNILGGVVFVAFAYWFVHLKGSRAPF